jgi:glycolate oxidase FAD binding subunit
MTATVPASVSAARVVVEGERDVVDVVRDARARGTPLRIIGAGTWLDAGRPVSAAVQLDVSRLTGITEYVPGDLTITARAGTALREIDDAARAHGQWLSLDPFTRPEGTVGATLATASAGPLASSVGLPRDLALGVAFVSGEGTLVRGGGRVVKNVAGFDLVRLSVGAWGTLGVIVEATLRLRALPEVDETVALLVPDELEALAALLANLRAPAVMPLASEIVSARLASAIGLPAQPLILVRLAGNTTGVREQRAAVARLGAARDVSPAVWSLLRAGEPHGVCVFRISRRTTELARIWRLVGTAVEAAGGSAHATVSRGVVRAWLPGNADIGGVLASLDPDDSRIFERLPAAVWPTLAPTRVDDPLARRVRDAFDPDRILNRGILGEAR